MVATQGAALDAAKQIFKHGTDCFGPDEVMAVFGKLHQLQLPDEPPPIPWSEEELVAARKGEPRSQLILVAPGLTLEAMVKARGNKGPDGGKLLFSFDQPDCWYVKNQEAFFTSDVTSLKPEWRLVTTNIISGSTGKNYLEQTKMMADCLREVIR